MKRDLAANASLAGRRRAMAAVAALALAGCVPMPDRARVDAPGPVGALPPLPAYDDPVWVYAQGLPLRRAWLREGRTPLPQGELFVLPHVLTDLPYKNVQETAEWVERVNRELRPRAPWRYVDERRMGHYKCMSVSASTILDWHALRRGERLPEYRSWLNGAVERGFDHRRIDALYYLFAVSDPEGFPLFADHLDPVERTPIPYLMSAFVRILTLAGEPGTRPDLALDAPDPSLVGLTHRVRVAEMLATRARTVFRYVPSQAVALDPGRYERLLVEALERDGPVYAGIRVRFATSGGIVPASELARLAIPDVSGHGVVIVGYLRQGDRTYFVYRETFGEHDQEWADGGPAYRVYPVHGFNEAYGFPR